MRGTNVLAGVSCVLLGIWVGIGWMQSVVNQHVPGRPSQTQILFYVGVPSAFVVALVLSAVIFNFVIRSAIALIILSVAALVALPFYLIEYGGGV